MSQALTSNGGVSRDLNQIEQPSLQPVPAPHQPGMFRSILAGVVGTAANMFAPGFGGVLGSLIGGRGSSPLGNLIGGGDSSFASGLAASGYAANAQNLADANEILAIARQSNRDQEMTELASNIEKSKHQTFMAVIQNIT